MENIGKDKVLAGVVRTFFKYFTLGAIEGNTADAPDADAYEPKNVKQVMSAHIEDVSRVFNQEAFYALSRMNYAEEELEKELIAFANAGNDTTPMGLMRFACRTTDCYDMMVSEYKRNFEALLCGSFASLADVAANYKMGLSFGEISVDLAESIINRIANTAYEEGKKLIK